MEAGFSLIEKNSFLVTIEALLSCVGAWETDAESTFRADFFFYNFIVACFTYHMIHPFQLYDLMVFRYFIKLCNYHHTSVL